MTVDEEIESIARALQQELYPFGPPRPSMPWKCLTEASHEFWRAKARAGVRPKLIPDVLPPTPEEPRRPAPTARSAEKPKREFKRPAGGKSKGPYKPGVHGKARDDE
jgi:hypothetical protein